MVDMLSFLCHLARVGESPDQLSPCIAVEAARSPSIILLLSYCNFVGESVACFTVEWVIFELRFVILV